MRELKGAIADLDSIVIIESLILAWFIIAMIIFKIFYL